MEYWLPSRFILKRFQLNGLNPATKNKSKADDPNFLKEI